MKIATLFALSVACAVGFLASCDLLFGVGLRVDTDVDFVDLMFTCGCCSAPSHAFPEKQPAGFMQAKKSPLLWRAVGAGGYLLPALMLVRVLSAVALAASVLLLCVSALG